MTSGSSKDKIKGKAKETLGKVTGDRGKIAEGKADQAKGRAKDALDDARKHVPGKSGPTDPLIRDDE
ncbi:CsbD family protein [Streptomyces sp. JH14]|uniref:CsbD family protein n=1 Tax=Streptomyces sp. JH14 TaxID=2793630 RepID=UPI0023F9D60E|nr:CsbD family protein [Streptomyces sp. JH14]MDF6041140.1 CsbD family protein [Streptomyces sp. JH14]